MIITVGGVESNVIKICSKYCLSLCLVTTNDRQQHQHCLTSYFPSCTLDSKLPNFDLDLFEFLWWVGSNNIQMVIAISLCYMWIGRHIHMSVHACICKILNLLYEVLSANLPLSDGAAPGVSVWNSCVN